MIIEFDTNNSAFDDRQPGNGGRGEIARILRLIGALVEDGHIEGLIRDINGNRIGNWKMNDND
jgi:hypothetical protein